MRVLAALLLVAALTACESNPPRTAPLFSPAPPAPQGHATLYIFRPYNDAGAAVWPVTYFNDVKIADVKVTSYTYLYLSPGHYRIRTERSQFLTMMGNIPFEFDVPATGDYYLSFGSPGASYTLPAGRAFVTVPGGDWDWHLLPESVARPAMAHMRYLPPYVQVLGP